uniref:Uncharacterized protein n=1 Tax=viral metagenome TaxID=1070528 RepID=A0A6C0KGD7_9ZZZZ
MSRPFNNGKPDLNAGDYIKNKKSKTIYTSLKLQSTSANNYDGTVVFENQEAKSFRTYELYNDTTLGYNLCMDCSGLGNACNLDPEIQTENSVYSVIDLSKVSVTQLFDGSINVLNNSGTPSTIDGTYVYIDPSNVLFGTVYEENGGIVNTCTTRAFMNYTDLSNNMGLDISGNNTNWNYLRCYDFPAKIKFT